MRLILTILVLITALSANKYTVAYLKDYYPYSYIDSSNNETGIVLDWWKLWSQKTNNDIEFIPMANINTLIDAVSSGRVSFGAGLFYSKDRSEKLGFSDPLLQSVTELFLKKSFVEDTLNRYNGHIAVISGDYSYDIIKEKYPNSIIDRVNSFKELINGIQNGNYDGFVVDLPQAMEFSPKFYSRVEILAAEELRPVYQITNLDLKKEIISGISQITLDEKIKLAGKWNILPKNTIENSDYSPWNRIILILIIIIIVLTISVIRLKKDAKSQSLDYREILLSGETDTVEFKSSLRFDYRQQSTNKKLELVIAKTVSAFLNTNGGILIIGVDDDGKVLGLENDYLTLNKKNRDGFVLALINVININLGKKSHNFITITIETINNLEVAVVSVDKSDTPVFFGKADSEEFYIRASASSQPLGLKETHEYIQSHWK